MKYTTLLTLTLATLLSTTSFAQTHSHAGEMLEDTPVIEQTAAADVRIDVNGLVCDFCAQAIQKVFKRNDAIADVEVDLTEKVVSVWFADGTTLDDAALTKLVQDSGYNVVTIHRGKAS